MIAVVVTGGALTGQIYSLKRSLLIGRDGEGDIQLREASASRRHASITDHEGQGVRLRDLASHNGTRVAGEKVTDVVLSPGESFSIGHATFDVVDIDPAQVQTEADTGEIHLLSGPASDQTQTDLVSTTELRAMKELARQNAEDEP